MSKIVNVFKHFMRNKFLGRELKTTDFFRRISKKKSKRIINTDKFAKSE